MTNFTAGSQSSIPPNPLGPTVGHCGTTGGNASWCEALHVLAKQLGLSYGQANEIVQPVTVTDMLATAPNDLTSRGFTALINPNQGNTVTIANPTPPPANITIVAPEAPAVATAIRDFVNAGGRYVGDRANGVLWARNAGFTNLNTTPTNVAPFNDQCYANQPPRCRRRERTSPAPTTPATRCRGASTTAASSTARPAATRCTTRRRCGSSAGPPAVPSTNVAISYSNPLTAFGYTCNAVGPGELPGRPW